MQNQHGITIHYIGETKALVFDGKCYPNEQDIEQAIIDAQWARRILGGPDATFPNGKQSHDVASDLLDKALLTLVAREYFGPNGPIAAPR